MSNLVAIAAYFNPSGCELRDKCFAEFTRAFTSTGIPLYPVSTEGDTAPIWQKERLLNRAIRDLPSSVDKVIWIDGDLVVASPGYPDWAMSVSAALDKWPIVQPWSLAGFLGPDGERADGPMGAPVVPSVPFANRNAVVPSGLPATAWPGFCCAARRDVLEAIGGLYEMDLSGPNDVLMSLAFYGDWSNPFLMRYSGEFRRHFDPWAGRAFEVIAGRVGYVGAILMHLWHGPFSERRYLERTVRLYHAGYDPAQHVATGQDGLLVLADDCPAEVRRLATLG